MLLEKINEDVKSALKGNQEAILGVLRQLLAAIKNEEIRKRPNELTEDDVLVVLKREVKKLRDAIKDFSSAGREDLIKQYQSELEILSKYLPEEMSEEDLRKIVKEVISNLENKSFGLIMKEVMSKIKGQADGSLVSKIVKEEI